MEHPFSTPCQTLTRLWRDMRYSPERTRRAVLREVPGISGNAAGNRLNLANFDGTGLNCNNWNFDDNANDNLGVFALMMGKAIKKRHPETIGMSSFSC